MRQIAMIAAAVLANIAMQEHAIARTRDVTPWHILNITQGHYDDGSGIANFIGAYATEHACLIEAVALVKRRSPSGCHDMSCSYEVWCFNFDDDRIRGVNIFGPHGTNTGR